MHSTAVIILTGQKDNIVVLGRNDTKGGQAVPRRPRTTNPAVHSLTSHPSSSRTFRSAGFSTLFLFTEWAPTPVIIVNGLASDPKKDDENTVPHSSSPESSCLRHRNTTEEQQQRPRQKTRHREKRERKAERD